MARKNTSREVDAEAVVAPVTEQINRENEQGFRGTEVDPTPNENYTLQGVTKGLPTPETDPATAASVGSTRFRGAALDSDR